MTPMSKLALWAMSGRPSQNFSIIERLAAQSSASRHMSGVMPCKATLNGENSKIGGRISQLADRPIRPLLTSTIPTAQGVPRTDAVSK